MGASEIAAVAGGVCAVLGSIGGVLRYLVRMAATMESTNTKAAETAAAFGRHVTASETFHAALTDRVRVHGEELAALRARVDGLAS